LRWPDKTGLEGPVRNWAWARLYWLEGPDKIGLEGPVRNLACARLNWAWGAR